MIQHSVREALFSPSAAEGIAAVFTIDKEGWTEPLRFTNHEKEFFSYDPLRSGLMHDGEEYATAVVSHKRPDDVPGSMATIPLVLENVVQDLAALLDESVNGLVVTLKHVAISDPDSVVEEFPNFFVLSAVSDLETNVVALQLTLDPLDNEPANMVRFTPDPFGALFP